MGSTFRRLPRPRLGFLIAPLIPTALSMPLVALGPSGMRIVAIVFVFNVALGYPVALAAGGPAYLLCRRLGWNSWLLYLCGGLAPGLACGALGAIAAVAKSAPDGWVSTHPRVTTILLVLGGGLCGGLSTGCFWLIVRPDRAEVGRPGDPQCRGATEPWRQRLARAWATRREWPWRTALGFVVAPMTPTILSMPLVIVPFGIPVVLLIFVGNAMLGYPIALVAGVSAYRFLERRRWRNWIVYACAGLPPGMGCGGLGALVAVRFVDPSIPSRTLFAVILAAVFVAGGGILGSLSTTCFWMIVRPDRLPAPPAG